MKLFRVYRQDDPWTIVALFAGKDQAEEYCDTTYIAQFVALELEEVWIDEDDIYVVYEGEE